MGKSRKSTQLLAYLTGVFDGEGSVFISRKAGDGGRYYLHLDVTNSFVYPLGLLLKEFPGGGLYCNKDGTWKAHYTNYQAQSVMEAMLPYSIIKYEQLKVGISFLNHRRRDHQHTKTNDCIRCEYLRRTIKDLKENNGVNSVNPMREYRAKPEEVAADSEFLRELLEGVETRLSESNKAKSAPEQDIVQLAVCE